MELCQTDLANVIGKGPLSRDGNTAFIRQMSVISEYLYQEKLIHRNITPSNILIKEKDTDDSMALYKLGGFGEVCTKPFFLVCKPLTRSLLLVDNC